jgi:hypothetical protein
VLVLIDFFISQVLALLEKQCEKRIAESVQVVKIAEQEVVVMSQADRIVELEATCADFKREKDKVIDGNRRLAEKHKLIVEKAEHDKTKLVENHAIELTKLHADLDLETRIYIEYRQNVRHWLHELHEADASSFEEVKAQCMPVLDKGVKVEEMIDWVVRKVKAVSDTVWRLNDNFTVLDIGGVLSMLNGEGCQELGRRLCDLAGSHDATVLENVPQDVHKLTG